ncbi:MAG: NAD-dependent epimerase/dehydratase family protein [Chloroflexi bacterium]|nr:NAD-dependent epimerase/dehydratase family protein [Chloroflexota bacterium]
MATYLVTGAAGMIGSKVAELLLRRGDEVVGVDDLCASYDVRLKGWRLEQLKGLRGFTFHQIDVSELASLEALFADRRSAGHGSFSAVINLAARAGVRDSLVDPWAFFRSNVTGTLNLLELCRRFEVGKFILASTSSLYGAHNPQPFREDANTDVLLSPYAASKKAAEALCSTYHHLYGIDVTVPRYFTVYGPAGRPDMAPFRFIKWIHDGEALTLYGDGSQQRDFTFVEDIARGTLAALKPVGYEVVNLGTERTTKLLDLIHLIETQVERKAIINRQPRHPADMLVTWADTGKAKALLGWEAITLVEEGIRLTVDWYRKNHSWAKEIAL